MKLIVLTIIYASIIPMFFVPLFLLLRKKDKRRDKEGLLKISKYGSFREVPLLIIFGLLFYTGLIICGTLCYKYSKLAGGYIGTTIIFVFCYIFFHGAISVKYGYVVLHDDCVTNACIFKRDNVVSYSDIKYYRFYGMHIIWLDFLDKYGLSVISISDINENNSFKIKQILENKSIFPIPDEIIQELKNSKFYKNNKNSDNAFGMTFICILSIAMTLLMFLLPETTNYLHYDANGTVISCTVRGGSGGTSYEFTLANDNHIYLLDNIAADNLKGYPFDKGNDLKLKIAYTDDNGKRNVSYIADDEKVYLTVADYEKAHNDNYKTKHVMAYVFLSLAIAFALLAVCFLIVYKKNKKKYSPK